MSNEITHEVLAKAIAQTKSKVHEDTTTVELDLREGTQEYKIINRFPSDKDNAMNAMAIAPMDKDGNVDYNHVAVVYAGTNSFGDKGRKGFFDAGASVFPGFSTEYGNASGFLKETNEIVKQHNGQITDVSGFSQSGGYLMKLTAQYAPTMGFKGTSFDDFGRDQIKFLNREQREWLKQNPDKLTRYQNESWAGLSGRDDIYGNVIPVKGRGFLTHDVLAKYLNGNSLDLDLMAKDGVFAPGMTKAQVRLAAENYVKRLPLGAVGPGSVAKRIKEYDKIYGSPIDGDLSAQRMRLTKLRTALANSDGRLTGSEKIYIETEEAKLLVQQALENVEPTADTISNKYRDFIGYCDELWVDTLSSARNAAPSLSETEIRDKMSWVGVNESSISKAPGELYGNMISDLDGLVSDFSSLIDKMQRKIDDLVEKDQELANQIQSIE